LNKFIEILQIRLYDYLLDFAMRLSALSWKKHFQGQYGLQRDLD